MSQMIITVSREFGSGGTRIAEYLAEYFNLTLYDKNILERLQEDSNFSVDQWEKYDERPKSYLASRKVKGYSSSMEENLAEREFHFLQQKADSGESFLALGRCAESALYGRENVISFFIFDDMEDRIKRVSEQYHLTPKETLHEIKKKDAKRKYYHSQFSNFKWGDSRFYDMCIQTSKLGVERTAHILEEYVEERMGRK